MMKQISVFVRKQKRHLEVLEKMIYYKLNTIIFLKLGGGEQKK